MTVAENDKHNVFYDNEIKEDTVTVALDFSGGMSDRLMLGRKGILYNANSSIECFNNTTDDYIKPFEITDDISDEELERAIAVLQQDNFEILMVLDQTIISENLIIGRDVITILPMYNNDVTVLDVERKEKVVTGGNIPFEFDENNVYNIY